MMKTIHKVLLVVCAALFIGLWIIAGAAHCKEESCGGNHRPVAIIKVRQGR